VSIDLQYREGSDTELHALLSVRDLAGRVHHRTFSRPDHRELSDVARWSAWESFLGQP
jgi:hypothetical protein